MFSPRALRTRDHCPWTNCSPFDRQRKPTAGLPIPARTDEDRDRALREGFAGRWAIGMEIMVEFTQCVENCRLTRRSCRHWHPTPIRPEVRGPDPMNHPSTSPSTHVPQCLGARQRELSAHDGRIRRFGREPFMSAVVDLCWKGGLRRPQDRRACRKKWRIGPFAAPYCTGAGRLPAAVHALAQPGPNLIQETVRRLSTTDGIGNCHPAVPKVQQTGLYLPWKESACADLPACSL